MAVPALRADRCRRQSRIGRGTCAGLVDALLCAGIRWQQDCDPGRIAVLPATPSRRLRRSAPWRRCRPWILHVGAKIRTRVEPEGHGHLLRVATDMETKQTAQIDGKIGMKFLVRASASLIAVDGPISRRRAFIICEQCQ